MFTSIRYLLLTLALGVPWVGNAWSTEPPSRGQVLLLENDRIIEGDIELVGNQYRVRRSVGETWLPRDKVRRLFATLDDVLEYLRNQANLNDPDERLRLARWCHSHGLRQHAIAEVKAAVELRPSHAESRLLLANLQRSQAGLESAPPPRDPVEPEPETPPVLAFNADSIGLFVSRVQPILMNTCANCHATGKGGAFKLLRTSENALIHRRTTQQNLAAVIAQLNRTNIQASPLLNWAVTVHGDTDQPPLKNRFTPAYRTLEDWVTLAMTDAPQRDPVPAPTTLPTAETKHAVEAKTVAEPSLFKSELNALTPAGKPEPKPTSAPKPAEEPKPEPTPKPATPPPPPRNEPVDPFDPMIFNKQSP